MSSARAALAALAGNRSTCWIGLHGQRLLEVTGLERLEFLQGLLTQDLRVAPGRAVASAMADRKGGWIADPWLLVDDHSVWITARTGPFAAMVAQLERHRFTARVEWREPLGPAPRAILAFGSGAARVAPALGLATGTDGREGGGFASPGGQGVWMRVDETSPEDLLLVVPAADGEFWRSRLEAIEPPVAAADREQFRLARIAAGTPWHGVDGDESVLVPEAVANDRVSLEKGCYLGQETIARIRHRGRVRQRLVRAWLAAPPPAPGMEILGSTGEVVGRITSAAPLPGGGSLALAWRRAGTPGHGARLATGGQVEWLDEAGGEDSPPAVA